MAIKHFCYPTNARIIYLCICWIIKCLIVTLNVSCLIPLRMFLYKKLKKIQIVKRVGVYRYQTWTFTQTDKHRIRWCGNGHMRKLYKRSCIIWTLHETLFGRWVRPTARVDISKAAQKILIETTYSVILVWKPI